jgi:uncharacterized protein YceH (UPF0502 family)
VLGSLLEKQLTTPQQYPLTITSLLAACNQTTNRDPIVDYDEDAVTSAIDELKRLRLVRSVLPSHGRSVVRYRHVLDETLALDTSQCALLAVLLLRGPQTVGELRIRTERMTEFDGLNGVENELEFLATREEPLTRKLGRRPGQKEERWATPLVASSPEQGSDARLEDRPDVGATDSVSNDGPRSADPLEIIRSELETLRTEVHDLRDELHALRVSLGD